MCGFIYRKSGFLKGQSGYLKHRGPDEQSYFAGENYELEFSRLTITGKIEGEVPVYSTNKEWLVAFNGEIYNFKSLIRLHNFPVTDSDTKVIANGLEKLGLNFFKELRGMYAGLAINTRTKATYVFRDPLGEKPLFYSYSDDSLLISSEFTALLKLLQRPLELNPKAMSDYFRFGYVEEPDSFDKSIRSVTRGSVSEINHDSKLIQVMSLPGYNEHETNLRLPDLLQMLDQEVSFSTVPTGLALSAGVDSTSLLYAMSKYRDAAFIPLIVNIDSHGLSTEAAEATAACKKLGIEPRLIQPFSSTELLPKLKELSFINDQPHADPSGLSYLSIFQEARLLGLKVVLLGHGPDELFWGYPWFNSQLVTEWNKDNSPRQTREYWDTPGKSSRLLWSFGNKNRTSEQQLSTDHYLQSFNSWEKYRAEIVHSYLSSNGLRQSDRLAMAYGVEPRTPYADSRLYGWAQENSAKSQESFDKKEFRSAVDLGPLEESRNRKKEGFHSPMGTWFQDAEINDFAGDCLRVISRKGVDWRIKPKLRLLSPSEKYRIIMLGSWLDQFA